MTPYQRAQLAHNSDPDNDPFEEVIVAHFLTGIVISTPDVFLLARPVESSDPSPTDPFEVYDNPDTWHIHLAAGDLSKIADSLPYPLPLVSFVRKNRLHFYRLAPRSDLIERIRRHDRKKETRRSATESELSRSDGAEKAEQAGRSIESTGAESCCR